MDSQYSVRSLRSRESAKLEAKQDRSNADTKPTVELMLNSSYMISSLRSFDVVVTFCSES